MANLDSFLISLTFDSQKAQESANKINSIVNDMTKKIVTAFVGIKAFDFLRDSVKQFVDQGTQLQMLSRVTGESVQNLNAWQQAVMRNGGTAEQFNQTLLGLRKNIQNIAIANEGGGMGALYALGVNAYGANGHLKSTTDLLLDLAGKFKGMDLNRAQFLGNRLGIDQATLLTLTQGRDKVQELINREKMLGVITQQQANLAREYKNTQLDLNQAWTNIKFNVISAILPALEKVTNWLTTALLWMRQNKSFMLSFFESLAVIITTALLPALARLAWATVTNPFILMVTAGLALVAIMGLLINDWEVYKQGGHAALSNIWKEIDTTKSKFQILKDLGNSFWQNQLAQSAVVQKKQSGNWHNLIDKIKTIWSEFTTWIMNSDLGKFFKDIEDAFNAIIVFLGLKNMLTAQSQSYPPLNVNKAYSAGQNYAKTTTKDIKFQKLLAQPASPQEAQANEQSFQSFINQHAAESHTYNIQQVHVHGVQDPKQFQDKLSQHAAGKKSLTHAAYAFDTGRRS